MPYKEKSDIAWHIYVDSDYIDKNSDFFEHLDFKDMNIEVKEFLTQLQYDIENCFLKKYKEYFNFKDKLIKNSNYPYNNKNISNYSKSKELTFIQIAYSIEQKYKLLSNNEKLVNIIYPLLDGCMDNPNLKNIINSINTLEKRDSKTI
ncbi:hypothetical protein OFS07_00555 [Brachyspira hyodysenteriae]|nr:hypothetical protein [Brachyspira hyodysenteriae]MDA0064779.1 hypothetical protein [Brachyspira hyodysenteriae]